MKGLIMKDLYMMNKYCRSILLIMLVFITVAIFQPNNMFYTMYPVIICSMVPISLVAYDERSKWNVYSDTLPYTRAQLVSVKFIIGLLCELVAILLMIVVRTTAMLIQGTFVMTDILNITLSMLIVGLICTSLTLPIIFKFGTEKGRIFYYIVIGFMSAIGAIGSILNLSKFNTVPFAEHFYLLFAALISVAFYVLAWRISISVYKKREL